MEAETRNIKPPRNPGMVSPKTKPQLCANPLCDVWYYPVRSGKQDGGYCCRACDGEHRTLNAEKYDERLTDKIVLLTQQLSPKLIMHKDVVRGPAMITADWHSPSIHLGMFERMLYVAKALNIRQLIVGGDFMDMRAFSGHPSLDGSDRDIITPRNHAREIIKALLKRFDRIILCPGNHDYWLVRYFLGAHTYTEWMQDCFGELMQPGRLCVRDFPYVYLRDAGNEFVVVHQRTFSGTNMQGVARDMESRRQDCRGRNVIVTHGHLEVGGRNNTGEYQAVSLGCMTDSDRTNYTKRYPMRHREWNPGFGFVTRGYFQAVSDIMPTEFLTGMLKGLRVKKGK